MICQAGSEGQLTTAYIRKYSMIATHTDKHPFARYFNNTIIKERYMDLAMFTDPGSDPLASPPLRFEDAWYPNLPEGQELPHINLIVTLEGVCDDNILRSELLVLLGVMRTRLLRVVLKDHIVAPVR